MRGKFTAPDSICAEVAGRPDQSAPNLRPSLSIYQPPVKLPIASGSDSRAVSWRCSLVGCQTSSSSRNAIQSPVALLTPVLRATEIPEGS